MARQRGLDPTLEALYQAGVYLSFQEFTGATEVIYRAGRAPQHPGRGS
ncbi:MAG: hypothetical protein ACRDGN_07165 [bacterium]